MKRVGVVGCGNIGSVHAMTIANLNEARLCAFADIRPDRARAFAEQYTTAGAAVYNSLEAMLDREDLDVVHICTPHVCHVPMAITALKKNCHVFLEKPPALSREEFEQLEQATDASRMEVGICFQNRYNQATEKVSELLMDGTLGTIRGGRVFVTWNRNIPYYTESDWRGTLKTEGGGVLINQSIHALDLLLMWMGKPVSAEASMHNHRLKGYIEVEDTLEAYLTFSAGDEPIRASFYATNAYVSDEPVFIELACEHGFVRMEGGRVWYQTKEQTSPVFWQEAEQTMPGKAYWGNGHGKCISDFYDCLNSGKPYRNNLASVETTFKTVMDIYDSARGADREKEET
ncbi:MAG: Gfo/Idh/MocA family protein [Lachnospiraceae bacterium]